MKSNNEEIQVDVGQRPPRLKYYLFRILAVFLTLVLVEIVARGLVHYKWTPARIQAMTTHGSVRGQFSAHQYLPYVLTPNYEDVNSLGFRGPEFTIIKKENNMRVICIGASTTFGIYVDPSQAFPGQLELILNKRGVNSEVINAGVPGWNSMEHLLNLSLRILPLKPDIVIVYLGRNEMFPQSFNNYQFDYSHFRRSDYHMANSNYLHKLLFRGSNAFMLASTYGRGRFGWSLREENPASGCIRFEYQPTSDELIRNLVDPNRNATYQRVVESMISICKTADVKIIFCSMAFKADKLKTGVLKNDPAIYSALDKQVNENNKIVQEACTALGSPFVDTATLAEQPDLLFDDCHMNARGHALRALMIADLIMDMDIALRYKQ